jgi:hypothetical protein
MMNVYTKDHKIILVGQTTEMEAVCRLFNMDGVPHSMISDRLGKAVEIEQKAATKARECLIKWGDALMDLSFVAPQIK